MLPKDKLKELLINDGWHIGDGVDDCAGQDDKAMDESLEAIFKLLDGRKRWKFYYYFSYCFIFALLVLKLNHQMIGILDD